MARFDATPVFEGVPWLKSISMSLVLTPVPTCIAPTLLLPRVWLKVSAKFMDELL